MTRSSERLEQDRQAFNNSNPNPRMRPNYHALISKLRTLSAIEDPRAAAMVCDDIIYQKLYGKAPRELWYLLQQVYSYWARTMKVDTAGNGAILEAASNAVTSDADLEKLSLPLDSQELKKAVREVISAHTPRWERTTLCECRAEFDSPDRWANHVRVEIWRVLKNA